MEEEEILDADEQEAANLELEAYELGLAPGMGWICWDSWIRILQNFQLLVFPLWNSELCWNCLMISLNSLISISASDPAKMRLLIPFLGIFLKSRSSQGCNISLTKDGFSPREFLENHFKPARMMMKWRPM